MPVATRRRNGISRDTATKLAQMWLSQRRGQVSKAPAPSVAKSPEESPKLVAETRESTVEYFTDPDFAVPDAKPHPYGEGAFEPKSLRERQLPGGVVKRAKNVSLKYAYYITDGNPYCRGGGCMTSIEVVAVLGVTEDGNVIGGFIHGFEKWAELYNAYFSANCGPDCVETVRRVPGRRALVKRVEGPHKYTVEEYDFGDGVKAYVLDLLGGRKLIDVVHNGKSLGGTVLRYSPAQYKVSEFLKPLVQRVADALGRERSLRLFKTVLKEEVGDLYWSYVEELFGAEEAEAERREEEKRLEERLKLSFPPPVAPDAPLSLVDVAKIEAVDLDGRREEYHFYQLFNVDKLGPQSADARVHAVCTAVKFGSGYYPHAVGALCTLNSVGLGTPPPGRVVWMFPTLDDGRKKFYMTDAPLYLSLLVTDRGVECVGVGDACLEAIKRATRTYGKAETVSPKLMGFKAFVRRGFTAYVHNFGKGQFIVYLVPRSGKPVAAVIDVKDGDWEKLANSFAAVAKELSKECRTAKCAEEARRTALELARVLTGRYVIVPSGEHKKFYEYLKGKLSQPNQTHNNIE